LNGKQKRVCLSGLEYPRKLINTSTWQILEIPGVNIAS
jgi:hypothetical protein